MPRRRTVVAISAAIVLVGLVTGLFIALPMIVRRVAVDRLARMTGRAVTLERVGLNPFTGRVALERFRLAQRGSADPALEVEALEVRLALTSLFGQHTRVKSLTLTAPRLHVARLSATEYDFSDLLALIPPADPTAKPSTRTVGIDRVTLTRGAIIARDDVTRSTWTLDDLTVDGSGLSTRSDPPGRLTVRAKLNGTPLSMEASSLELARVAGTARVTVEGFDVVLARQFIPSSLGITPTAGRVSLALDLKVEKGRAALPRVLISGEAKLEGVAVLMAPATDPFVKVAAVTITIKDAVPLDGVISLDTVTIDTVDLKIARDAQGQIDLLALAQRPAPAPATSEAPVAAPAAAPAGGAPAERSLTVAVREVALRGTTVTLRDDTVKSTLALTGVTATIRDLKWPGGAPLTFEFATGMPGAGRLEAKGTATLAPVGADLVMSMRGAPIEPYHPYIPIPGRIVATFNAESHSRFTITDGKLTARSQGKSWIEGIELREPGGTAAPLKIARVAIDGIDFAHPGAAKAKTITITKPQARIERAENGDINLRRLFAAETPPITTTRTPAPVSPPVPPPSEEAAMVLTAPMQLEIGAIVIEDGDARFLDRTTKPAFSETITRLAVRVDNLSSEPGRRAKLAVQAIVGSDSALELKGELAPFGALYADVSGEMRRFVLPTVNPYAQSAIAWIIERGTLTAKLHYRIERNQITAQNEIIVENLHVARSGADDEVQKRIGLPLGMIVALVTDSDNSIRVNLPITGSLQSWSADLSDAIWTVVKNAVVNIVSAPFKAIGRLFTGGGDKIESMAVDPARFAPGSAAVAPEAEGHLTKVADFLRRSPAVKLTLAPVTTPADSESLGAQELTARLQRVQREAKLADAAAASAAEFKRVFPGEALPKTTEEQLARLRESAPVPPEALEQLAKQRLDAVRETLATREGIPTARLVPGPSASATSGEGRVEFKIGQ